MDKKTKKHSDFQLNNSKQLLGLMNNYANIVNQIIEFKDEKDKKQFLTANVVGDYAELLVAKTLGLSRKEASHPCVDAVNKKTNDRYQIKSRWMNGKINSSKREFGKIPLVVTDKLKGRKSIEELVDYIVLVIFEKAIFDEPIAYIIKVSMIKDILKAIEEKIISNRIITVVEDGKYYKIKYYNDAYKEACDKKLIEPLTLIQ